MKEKIIYSVQEFENFSQKWITIKTDFNTKEKAVKFGIMNYNRILKNNKKTEKDFRLNSFGSVQIFPTRIISNNKNKKIIPITQNDKKLANKFPKIFNK